MNFLSRFSGQEKNDALFEDLAIPLLRSLYNFAHWLTHDHHQAEDLVQETYVRALKGFSSFQQGTDFRAWMFRILRNRFLSSRTGPKAAPHLSIEEEDFSVLPPVKETPESLLIGDCTRDLVRNALERLPAIYREVILLCDVEEMKYKDIAVLIEVPVGTVMSRIARGRKILRGMLVEERLRIR